jgi:hypothetical protein
LIPGKLVAVKSQIRLLLVSFSCSEVDPAKHFYIMKSTLGQATKAQKGIRSIALLFLKLGVGWGWVVNATFRPLYPRGRPGTHSIEGAWGSVVVKALRY